MNFVNSYLFDLLVEKFHSSPYRLGTASFQRRWLCFCFHVGLESLTECLEMFIIIDPAVVVFDTDSFIQKDTVTFTTFTSINTGSNSTIKFYNHTYGLSIVYL